MNKTMQNIITLIKENRWNSIFFQFLKKIFVFMLIPFIIILIVTYAFFSNSLEKDFTKLIGSSLQKTCSSISELILVCDNHYLDLAFSQQIINLLITDFSEDPMNVEKNLNYFSKNNLKIMHTSPGIKNIILYNKLNEHIRSNNFSGYVDKFQDEEWFRAYKANENNGKNIFMISNGEESFLRCYKILLNKKYLGCLMFELTPDVQNQGSNNTPSILDNIIMIDNKNAVFYNQSNDTDIINDDFITEAFSHETLLKKHGDSFIYSQRSNNSDYIIVSVSNSHHLAGTYTKFNIFFFSIVLTLSLLLLCVSIYLSSYIYKSILKITSLLQDSPNHNNEDNHEIYYITQQILSVVNERNNIEKELTDKINQLKKAQITALNTQVSPHFIFNTLNLVNAVIMNIVKKPNDAERVVGILADTFYYSLRNENYIVDIEDEVYYTKKFIEIEQIKLEGNFDVSFDVDPGVYGCNALKFMLQPLVENSFRHGISKLRNRRGLLKIKIYEENNCLICRVFDNGEKIDENKLIELNNQLNKASIADSNDHLGLNNVNTRIRLIWGDNYGCSIVSDEEGTTVTVKIPLIRRR